MNGQLPGDILQIDLLTTCSLGRPAAAKQQLVFKRVYDISNAYLDKNSSEITHNPRAPMLDQPTNAGHAHTRTLASLKGDGSFN